MSSVSKWLAICAAVLLAGASSITGETTRRTASPEDGLRCTILYDNYLHKQGTKPDWGFSCLIEGTEKTILFDTGTDPQILLHNVDTLGIDLSKIDLIVLSHDHGDHTGGLSAVLERNHDVIVYFPVSFPASFGRSAERLQARVQTVDKPVEICRHVYLTGEMGISIKEQSLFIDTDKGLIVVTGCSHPGIVDILKRCREVVDKPIRLVFGGFHLLEATDAEMKEIIAAFRSLGVEKCGATHCTGDAQIAMFKKALGEDHVPMGTGRVIEFSVD